jgi:hypothetical protein
MLNKSDSKTQLDPNFIETINLLNDHDIPYWICHGTLLGIIRDGALIPWDHDIDLALWGDVVPKNKIIEMMTARGYTVEDDGSDYDYVTFTKEGGRKVDFNYYRIMKKSDIAFSEWPLPKSIVTNLLYLISNKSEFQGKWCWLVTRLYFLSSLARYTSRILKRAGLLYKSAGYTTPANLLEKFEFIEVSGIKVKVPCAANAILVFLYGDNWRVPKQEYNWVEESPATHISNARL